MDEYELSEVDVLCLTCPLPECNETDPACPRRQATARQQELRLERQRAYQRAYRERQRVDIA